jgi:hypothetical protein
VKKPRKKMTWDDLLKIEDKHPFFAGNPMSALALPSRKSKVHLAASKKSRSRRHELTH